MLAFPASSDAFQFNLHSHMPAFPVESARQHTLSFSLYRSLSHSPSFSLLFTRRHFLLGLFAALAGGWTEKRAAEEDSRPNTWPDNMV